eukprot:6197874-Pleurochrysis_carterae.AAC.1
MVRSNCSQKTLSEGPSRQEDAGPSAEVPKLAAEFADAEPLEEAGASSALPHVRWARVVAEREERWKDIQARMDAIQARTKRNQAQCLARNSLSVKSKNL